MSNPLTDEIKALVEAKGICFQAIRKAEDLSKNLEEVIRTPGIHHLPELQSAVIESQVLVKDMLKKMKERIQLLDEEISAIQSDF